MKRAITFTEAPYWYDNKWYGGGEKHAVYIDAIIGFSEAGDGPDGMKITRVYLITNRCHRGVGTIGEFVQKVTDAELAGS